MGNVNDECSIQFNFNSIQFNFNLFIKTWQKFAGTCTSNVIQAIFVHTVKPAFKGHLNIWEKVSLHESVPWSQVVPSSQCPLKTGFTVLVRHNKANESSQHESSKSWMMKYEKYPRLSCLLHLCTSVPIPKLLKLKYVDFFVCRMLLEWQYKIITACLFKLPKMHSKPFLISPMLKCDADFLIFIECFTTTFLRAHSWLNWVDEDDDEDEVGLKEARRH